MSTDRSRLVRALTAAALVTAVLVAFQVLSGLAAGGDGGAEEPSPLLPTTAEMLLLPVAAVVGFALLTALVYLALAASEALGRAAADRRRS